MGPGKSNHTTNVSNRSAQLVRITVEPIDIKNPRPFWIVNALPTVSTGHDLDEIAVNCAASAITKNHHTSNTNIDKPGTASTSGYVKHTVPEISNDIKATRLLPDYWLITPPDRTSA